MATVGSAPSSWTSFRFTGWNTENNVAQHFTMPETGDTSAIDCFMSGYGAPVNAQLAVWNDAGTLLVASSLFSAAATAQGAWQHVSVPSVRIAGGTGIWIGWWRDPANGLNCVWSYAAGGPYITGTTANSTGVGALPLPGTSYGFAIGAFLTYTPYVPPQTYVDGGLVQVYVDGSPVDVYVDGVKMRYGSWRLGRRHPHRARPRVPGRAEPRRVQRRRGLVLGHRTFGVPRL